MTTRGPLATGHLAKRFKISALAALIFTSIFLIPLLAQTAQQPPPKPAVAAAPAAQKPIAATPQAGPAKTPEKAPEPAKKPLSWADQILQQEGYATPPKEVADAVLAPRWQNVSLSSASPDKKWFLNQISDGPVPMSIFSKPFHELGGVFIDFKANRSRTLTIGTNVGIQAISGAAFMKRFPP